MISDDSLIGPDEQGFIELYKRFYSLYYSDERVIIYGTGRNALQVFNYLQKSNLQIIGFCDNSAIDDHSENMGLPVLSTQTAIQLNCIILIASSWHVDIADRLKKLGFSRFINVSLLAIARFPPIHNIEDKIKWLCSVLDTDSRQVLSEICKSLSSEQEFKFSLSSYPQYRHPDFKLLDQAVIIDAGACRGEIFGTFADQLSQKTFVCFEPDPLNAEYLRLKNTSMFSDCYVFVEEKGLWSNNKPLRFRSADISGANFNCSIVDDGNIEIQTCSLDAYLSTKELKPDLIKMDIEGAEYEALEGSRMTLVKYRPLLAICTYHYLDDLWLLPEWIADLDLGYRFSLGHHAQNWFETVLYAKAQKP